MSLRLITTEDIAGVTGENVGNTKRCDGMKALFTWRALLECKSYYKLALEALLGRRKPRYIIVKILNIDN